MRDVGESVIRLQCVVGVESYTSKLDSKVSTLVED
jgi:hypothetical protein